MNAGEVYMNKKRLNIAIAVVIFLVMVTGLVFLVNKKEVDKNEKEVIVEESQSSKNTINNVKDLIYDAGSKKECVMDVSYIKNGEKKPLILCIHGGYYSIGDKEEMNTYLSRLSPDGFVVASVNYPLLPDATIVQQIDSVINAMDYLAEYADLYEIDTNHMILLGFSSGAQIAVTAAEKIVQRTDNGFRLDAVIDISGPTDYRYLIEQDGGKTEVPAAIIDGNSEADVLEELSKIDCTDNITDKLTNVFIIHGETDQTVPAVVSERFCNSLIEAGVHAELKMIGSMGHVTNTEIVIPMIESYLKGVIENGE